MTAPKFQFSHIEAREVSQHGTTLAARLAGYNAEDGRVRALEPERVGGEA